MSSQPQQMRAAIPPLGRRLAELRPPKKGWSPPGHATVVAHDGLQKQAPNPGRRRCARTLRTLRSRQPGDVLVVLLEPARGIVTDPALMVIPFDDHMCTVATASSYGGTVDGKIYDLEAHLDRFLLSAERSKLRLPAHVGRSATSS